MGTILNNQNKIQPCLWFDNNAEEAVSFYTTVFKKSKIGKPSYYGEGAPMPKGTVLVIPFELEGQNFLALNGGPHFKFNEAISLSVNCNSQEEIDYFWNELSKGGAESMCGWLKDKFGLSWQVVPEIIQDMLTSENEEKVARVTEAIFKMRKIDLKVLEDAFNGI